VDHLTTTVATAVVAFVGTNIDDLVLVGAMFMSAQASGHLRAWQIVVGQYLGIGALVGASTIAARVLGSAPARWVGLLGLVPLGIGAWGLLRLMRRPQEPVRSSPRAVTGVAQVVGVTIAAGVDNVSVYTPLFRASGPGDLLVAVTVFAVLLAACCAAGAALGTHPRVEVLVERAGGRLVPFLYAIVGLAILARSGVFHMLF
jgi:cadmium resistance protein CadD (predicted permease)